MYLVEVLAISKSAIPETLSYFSAQKIAVGCLVLVPLRKQKVLALTIDCQIASQQKTNLKTSNFALKKVLAVEENYFSKDFIQAVQATAEWHTASFGQTFIRLLPQIILKNLTLLKSFSNSNKTKKDYQTENIQSLHYQTELEKKVAEAIERQESVFIVTPTISDIKILQDKFSTLGFTVITLSSELTLKQLEKAIAKLTEKSQSVVIIGTAPFLNLWPSNISTLFLYKENSRAYKTMGRATIDLRVFVQKFAENKKCHFVLVDNLLRLETIYQNQSKKIWSKEMAAPISIVSPQTDQKFSLFDRQVQELLCKAVIEKKKIFVFCAKRGLSSQTICADCGEIILCDNCSTPITLHAAKPQNIFICHKCQNKQSTNLKCPHCNGYRLQSFGIGIEKVATELKQIFPQTKIWRLDKDSVKNIKQAQAIIKDFETNNGILLGTEMALTYLIKVHYSVVATLDNLFALPDFHTSENYLRIVSDLLSKTSKQVIIQTRQPQEKVFEYLSPLNYKKYFQDEIKARQKYQYPPFQILVKISYQNTPEKVSAEMEKLKDFLSDYSAIVYPAFVAVKNQLSVYHLLIKIPFTEWPDQNLIQKIKKLPPIFKIEVNPDSLL